MALGFKALRARHRECRPNVTRKTPGTTEAVSQQVKKERQRRRAFGGLRTGHLYPSESFSPFAPPHCLCLRPQQTHPPRPHPLAFISPTPPPDHSCFCCCRCRYRRRSVRGTATACGNDCAYVHASVTNEPYATPNLHPAGTVPGFHPGPPEMRAHFNKEHQEHHAYERARALGKYTQGKNLASQPSTRNQ